MGCVRGDMSLDRSCVLILLSVVYVVLGEAQVASRRSHVVSRRSHYAYRHDSPTHRRNSPTHRRSSHLTLNDGEWAQYLTQDVSSSQERSNRRTGSGSGSGSTVAPTPPPTVPPTTATTTTISQTAQFVITGGAAAYTGLIKKNYEYGYGKNIGVITCTTGGCSLVTGCTLSSSASDARRTSVD